MPRISILLLSILALAGCRSSKSSSALSSDSIAYRSVNVESLTSRQSQDSSSMLAAISFRPGDGEIQVMPSGEIVLKAVENARLDVTAQSSYATQSRSSGDSISIERRAQQEIKEISQPVNATSLPHLSLLFVAAIAILVLAALIYFVGRRS